MPIKIADRVKETSLTQGSGTLTLEGAFGGFQTFSTAIGDGNSTYYAIENESQWEVGVGTYTASSNTLSRDTVLQSSNNDSKIDIYGVATVFCTYAADKAIFRDENGDITESGLLTLKRDSAGNFLHAYKDDAYDRTVGLYTDGNTSPEWRLGLKSSPSSETAAPSYGYVYGKDGEAGVVANSYNKIKISNSTDFSVIHNNLDVLRASSTTGIHLNANSAAYPAVTINGAAAQSQPLTEWTNSAGTVLSIVDKDGSIGINKDSTDYELDVNGSGRLESISLTSGVYFQDGTFQSTASKNYNQEIAANTASGIAISGWAKSYVDSQDHSAAAVSGWAGSYADAGDAAISGWTQAYVDSQDHSAAAVSGWVDGTFLTSSSVEFTYISGIAVYASGQVDQNSSDIITVSGLLYDDASISGYIDLQDAAVSGWVQAYVDGQDHSATAVSGWAGSYADAGDAAVSGWADSTMTSRDNAVSGWAGSYADAGDAAVSGWTQAYVDSQDHSATAVSGWAGSYADAGDAAVSGWADSTMDTRDAAVSGWAQAYVDSQDHSATAVSGWAGSYADAGDAAVSGWADNTFNLQEVTDRGSNTTNSIVTSGNITASTGIFDGGIQLVGALASVVSDLSDLGDVDGVWFRGEHDNTTSGLTLGFNFPAGNHYYSIIRTIGSNDIGLTRNRSLLLDCDTRTDTSLSSQTNSVCMVNAHKNQASLSNANLFGVYNAGDEKFVVTSAGSLRIAAAIKTPITTDTDGATITFDMDVSNLHTVTLGGNRVLAVSNVDVGQKFTIRLVQDGTGTRTVTWFSTIKWPGGLTPTLTTTGGKTDVFGFICTAANTYDGFVIGYNL